MNRRRFLSAGVPLLTAPFVASACGGGEEEGGGNEGGSVLRIAAAFSGTVNDNDYNQLGYEALLNAEQALGAETTYNESTTVDDVVQVMQGYLADGYNVIWTHGSQFYRDSMELAAQNAEVTFIAENDEEPQDAPPNLWTIDRNFHTAFYPIGALAAMVTQTGRIGYICGPQLPFSYSEVHAIRQAISDLQDENVLDGEVTVHPHWTNDFNDTGLAMQTAQQLINDGCDVIISSLNLGTSGVLEAVKDQDGLWATVKYTDKSEVAPNNYLTACLYDFTTPLATILDDIRGGTRTGYYLLGFDSGVSIQPPPASIDSAIVERLNDIVQRVRQGDIVVEKNLEPLTS